MPCRCARAGLPIRPAFSRKLPSRPKLRRQLGMAQHTPAVLLVGGGEGMGALEETVAQLDKKLGDKCQVRAEAEGGKPVPTCTSRYGTVAPQALKRCRCAAPYASTRHH